LIRKLLSAKLLTSKSFIINHIAKKNVWGFFFFFMIYYKMYMTSLYPVRITKRVKHGIPSPPAE
jgi:hypothetical protein